MRYSTVPIPENGPSVPETGPYRTTHTKRSGSCFVVAGPALWVTNIRQKTIDQNRELDASAFVAGGKAR